MSSSDPVFTAHSSFTQQNGDVGSMPIRATMESIKSVHENPFYKNFGIKHSSPSYPRQVNRSVVSEEISRLSSNGRSSSVDDDIGEYRPGSGYVHKLLGKFSSLTAREDQAIPISHLKRSSSLDELPVENEALKDNATVSRTVGLGYEKPSFLSAAKLSHRARSIESLNHSHHKSHHGTGAPHHHIDTKWGMDKQFTHKFQRDSQVVALDNDLARDDIIVENMKSVSLLEDVEENERYDETTKVVSSHEAVLQDELPRPNTVLTVRNIFESASSGSVLQTRRQRSDSPSSVSMQSVKPVLSPLQASHISASSQDSGLNRTSSHISSPLASPKHTNDTHSKPILLPTSSSLSKAENVRHASDSDLPSRSNVHKSMATISSISGMSISRPQTSSSSPYRTNASPTSPSAFSPVATSDGRLFRFDRESSLETPGTSDSLHNASSHSASNAKALITGVQLYASAISSNQKSNHAINSSSFKDKLEDGKHYEHPVMIFEKSNLSPKKSQSQRIRDYTPLNDSIDAVDEENELRTDVSHSKEMKSHFEVNDYTQSALESTSKVLSQKRIFEPNSKNISNRNISDQSKAVSIRNQSSVEVKNIPKSALDHEKSTVEDKSKNVAVTEVLSNVAIKKSNVRKLMAPASSEPQPVPLVSNIKDSKKRVTFAVIPIVQEDDEKSVSNSSDGITTSGELISDLHNETTGTTQLYPNEPPALNEQPLSDVSKDNTDSKEQPIKGIPSIVAQRLKKQHFDPSQVAEDVFSSSDANEHQNEASRKHLSSASAKTSSDNTEKSSLGAEIENEISTVRKKMEESRTKSSGLVPIFDSSQLSKKRKEKKKQQASAAELVPALDLSGITDDQAMEYQPQNKKIALCNIVFIGENAKTARSLLTKQRKIKINIHFNDAKTESFEYPSEAIALEMYLDDHPHERDEILVLEDFTGGGDESSDDVEVDVFETPVTPRGSADDDLLKSNTAMSHTGSLQSYRGRFQQDYELGTVHVEEPNKSVEPEPVVDPEKLMLRPAEEDDTNTWSTSSSSDILF